MTEWGNRILATFVDEVREDVEGLLTESHPVLGRCESPIERAFGTAFMMLHGYFRGRPSLLAEVSITADAPQQFMVPQFEADGWRVDFLIGWNIGEHRHTSIVVECDGHAFHEKTKEQAARDKARDRALSAQFARVLRFTGSELYRNPCACAVEAYQISDQIFWDYMLARER